jgi:hypothetical protein
MGNEPGERAANIMIAVSKVKPVADFRRLRPSYNRTVKKGTRIRAMRATPALGRTDANAASGLIPNLDHGD